MLAILKNNKNNLKKKNALKKKLYFFNIIKKQDNYFWWVLINSTKKIIIKKSKNLRFKLLKKKIKLEQILTFILKKPVEIKIQDILSSKKITYKFRKSAKKLASFLKKKKKIKRYLQKIENINLITLGLFFNNSLLISSILARTLSSVKFKFFKKTLATFKTILQTIHATIIPYNSIRINISGKFKGKARRTNMVYFCFGVTFKYKLMNKNIFDYTVDYINTFAGVFGIKVWLD